MHPTVLENFEKKPTYDWVTSKRKQHGKDCGKLNVLLGNQGTYVRKFLANDWEVFKGLQRMDSSAETTKIERTSASWRLQSRCYWKCRTSRSHAHGEPALGDRADRVHKACHSLTRHAPKVRLLRSCLPFAIVVSISSTIIEFLSVASVPRTTRFSLYWRAS